MSNKNHLIFSDLPKVTKTSFCKNLCISSISTTLKSLYQSSTTKICSTGSLCEKQRCHPWILVGSSLISSSNKHVCKNINQTNADTQYAETTLNEIENFQLDLPMMVENESVVQNISYSKSKVYGNRIHLLGNLADFLAHSRSIWISCQVGGFSMAIDLGFQMKYFLNIKDTGVLERSVPRHLAPY